LSEDLFGGVRWAYSAEMTAAAVRSARLEDANQLAGLFGQLGHPQAGDGAVALAAASTDAAGRSLVVWLIIAREILGGVVSDLWLVKRGYASRRFYSGFVVFHLAVIVSGLLVLR